MQRMNDIGTIEPGRNDCGSSGLTSIHCQIIRIKHKTPLAKAFFAYYMQFGIAFGRRQIGYLK